LKVKYDGPLSKFALKFNLRHYTMRVAKPSAAQSGIYSEMGSSIKGMMGGKVSDKSRVLAVTVLRDVDSRQGLTLVHFSAQRKRFLWASGIGDAFRG